MTKTEQDAYDVGFLAAAECRARVAVLTGEADECDREKFAADMVLMSVQLCEATERVAQLEAGFRPIRDVPIRLPWVAFSMAFAAGAVFGLLAGYNL